MSYAIIRNEKLTRAESYGAYVHNDRKAKNHSNKDIDPTRTHLNFYCKENETTYIREFDRMKKEYDLQGNLRKNSIIMCQMMITSDNEFFKIRKSYSCIRCTSYICSVKKILTCLTNCTISIIRKNNYIYWQIIMNYGLQFL